MRLLVNLPSVSCSTNLKLYLDQFIQSQTSYRLSKFLPSVSYFTHLKLDRDLLIPLHDLLRSIQIPCIAKKFLDLRELARRSAELRESLFGPARFQSMRVFFAVIGDAAAILEQSGEACSHCCCQGAARLGLAFGGLIIVQDDLVARKIEIHLFVAELGPCGSVGSGGADSDWVDKGGGEVVSGGGFGVLAMVAGGTKHCYVFVVRL